MDAALREKAEDIIKAGIEWIDSHQDEETAVYKNKQKDVEEEIRPMLMSMYGAKDMSNVGGGEGSPMQEEAPMPMPGPKVPSDDID